MKKLKNVDFLLFDLGNVIINIDYSFTINELTKRLPKEKHSLTSEFFPAKFHKDYEKGLISTVEFREAIKNHFQEPWEDNEIDYLWNSLLKDIPNDRIDLIKKLSEHYGLAVLSNTNELHIEAINILLKKQFGVSSLHDIFDEVYFSHELQLAKPDPNIYQKVSELLATPPTNILFFDDLKDNIESAKNLGYQTHHVTHPQALISYFENVQH
ncbi:HAD family hydrolase [Belliella kenyensis]|uniref:HAD family hydrolase n=1 Tax=Belliella kenyensis TaxID=1472724 RepID=A0ABV8EF12_9BACT|nr:HAD family phosphatase [Belliella kenyensis]MCH7401818.1 HAD family phosphatase [Belliella kenyensis]MDN3604318.1 HAD family phosphatase [Belliella kenyensis]